MSTTTTRPTTGQLEQRSLGELTVEGRKLRGIVPYGQSSADLGGWTEVMEPGCLRGADLSDLVLTIDHAGIPLGRHPGTLTVEDRADCLAWSCEPPRSREDIVEAVERGDIRSASWRMVVGRDEWRDGVRHIHEVKALKDVSLVQAPAYPGATAELRSEPPPVAAPLPLEEPPVPDPIPSGGLILEDRTAADHQPSVETRILEALRAVPKGEARDLSTATVANVSPPELSDYLFQKLRPSSVALATGITVMSTDRETIQWPMLTADVQPGFVAELAVIPEGDPGFATLTATPRKLAHRTVVSNEVIDDSDPSITDVLSAHIGTMLGLKLDLSVYAGDGTANSIVGLANTPGIQNISMGTNGAAFTNLDTFADARGSLQTANAPGSYVVVMHPAVWQALSKLKDSQGRPLLEPFASSAPAPLIYGMPVYTTSQLSLAETQGTSSVTSSIYVYAPSQVVLVRRQDVSVQLDRSRLFDQDASEMRGTLRADLLVPNPSAVVRISGVKLS